VFFFSSRRRHTRSKRDWSSDVCSSDLFNKMRGALDLALPLLSSGLETFQVWGMYGKDAIGKITQAWEAYSFGVQGAAQMNGAMRSEERRVGKGGRSRGGGGQGKKRVGE